MRRIHHTPPSHQARVVRRTAIILDEVLRGYTLLGEAVIELADADAASTIARLIGLRLDVPLQLVARALELASDEPIMLLCRGAGLDINAFSAVMRMRRRCQSGDAPPADALNAFLEMPVATARARAKLLKVVRTRQARR